MRREEDGGDPKDPLTRALRVRIGIFAALAIAFLIPSLVRTDGLYFFHFWMPILWTSVLILSFVTLRPRALIKPASICFAVWFAAVFALRDPGLGVFLPPMGKPEGSLRVVVLNCAGGETEAIKEALAVEGADVWLLQETTGPKAMRKVLDEVDPSLQVVADFDACIVARQGLIEAPKAGNSAAAKFDWKGQMIRVVSLRLMPPVFRLDWWSGECHRAYQQDMVDRRAQMAEILAGSKILDHELAILGGDFNSTNRPAFAALMPGWREADRVAGRGWPGTGTNDYPLTRVDCLWSSPKIEIAQSFVRKTAHSDHRMVITDYRALSGTQNPSR